MMERLRQAYYRQQYHPGLPGLFINPFFLARRSLWRGRSLPPVHPPPPIRWQCTNT